MQNKAINPLKKIGLALPNLVTKYNLRKDRLFRLRSAGAARRQPKRKRIQLL